MELMKILKKKKRKEKKNCNFFFFIKEKESFIARKRKTFFENFTNDAGVLRRRKYFNSG